MLKGKVQHLRFHFSIQNSAFSIRQNRRSGPDDRPPSFASRTSEGKPVEVIETFLGLPAQLAERAKVGGKSELRRAVRRVTPGRGNPKDSGTENTPPTCRV
jgi:hypothetical protein